MRLVVLAIATVLCGAGSLLAETSARQTKLDEKEPKAVEPQAPTVELLVVPDRESIERMEQVALVVIVTNKSSASLTQLQVSVQSAAFESPGASGISSDVGAFGTAHGTLLVKPRVRTRPGSRLAGDSGDAAFGPHKLVVIAEYAWASSKGSGQSAQSTAINLQVKRRFEEEAKGLPGGSAAILYLFLPIVPAFLAFDIMDRLRKKEPLRLPPFGPEHVLPALLLSVLLSIGFTTAASLNVELAYSSPSLFLGVLGLSAILGALVPTVLLLRDVGIRRRWSFKEQDSPAEYLRKALLKPSRPSSYKWVEGTVGADTWQGVSLRQPDGVTVVLGAQLQANPVGADAKAREGVWTTLKDDVFDKNGAVKNCPLLVNLIKAGQVSLSFNRSVKRDGREIPEAVAVDGLKEFKETETKQPELVPLVVPVS